MKNPWILVTGASGFIGSTIVRKLVERGEKVKGLVRPGADLRPLQGLPPENFQLAVGEATVDHTVFRALAGCSQLFHAAGTFKFGNRRARETLDGSVWSMRGSTGAPLSMPVSLRTADAMRRVYKLPAAAGPRLFGVFTETLPARDMVQRCPRTLTRSGHSASQWVG